MKIKLLAMGKIKNSAFAEVVEDYALRIKRFNPFEVLEIPDEPVRNKFPLDKILQAEAKKIQKRMKPDAYFVALDEKGKQWTSVELAWGLKNLFESPHSEIIFLMGGAHGLAPELKARAHLLLSLSKLTLPHQLARVLALEQIYRALTILKNVPYHYE